MAAERFPEIDAVRGTAVVMMVVFHMVFDASFFGILPVDVAGGFWRAFALATATTFILLAGLSLPLSAARAGASLDGRGVSWKIFRRGASIFLIGMAITLVTWLVYREGFILFGVLHCIGLSIAISPLFLRLGKANLLAGAGVLLLAPLVAGISGPLPLAWLGIHPPDFASLDYVPVVPWFGVFLAGMGLSPALYPGGRRAFPAPSLSNPLLPLLTFLGRHSLPVYLVHQPVILLVLALLVPGFSGELVSFLVSSAPP